MAIKFETDPAKAKIMKRPGTGRTARKAGVPAAELRNNKRASAKMALRRKEAKKRRK